MTIRPATAADRATLADSLASAFSQDPLFSWMAGAGPTKPFEPRGRIVFDAFLRLELARDEHLVFADEEGTGVAIWKAPDKWKMPTGDMVRALPAMLRAFGTKATRMIGAFNAIEKVHPKEEHYYLEALGTRQGMQSKGVGSAVIRHMLDRCDAEGMPAYLESSNPRNVPFYARHGFEATGEIDVGKGAPTVTAMWRDAR
ncbi:MAG TPA: GNAT family N-acetyltransferase [Acidimicrobiales bacterium]|nr:GNAT family N-acetyltransferase [Acidimicrobiales bacterium]